jgi:uncharacterized protein (DUF2235 family)
MNVWEPGDRVFVFGFSRGAYAARVLAGMLHALGLLPHGNLNLVPYVMRLYGALRKERSGATKWSAVCDQFRWTFARAVPEDPDDRHFPVHFVGLWDTVSSVGWAWDPGKFPYTARNPSVHSVRHAVSIDERRWFFRQNRMYQASASQEFAQVWFPGVHSDVGGGYSESESGLWREPLMWVLEGATKAALLVDAGRQARVLSGAHSATPCDDPKHESLTAKWWPAEFFPKWQWRSAEQRSVLAIGAGRYRRIVQGELIHRCALTRLRDRADYRPRNLDPQFVQAVQSLPVIPDAMPYNP